MQRTLGVALAGTGFMGKAHTNAYKTIPYIFTDLNVRPVLAALFGRDPLKTAEQAELYGYARHFTDLEALLAQPEIDVVDVSMADGLHKSIALAAIAAGKHVVCEKPLALSAADAKEMWEAAQSAGIVHMVCFNYRFLPAVRLAHQMLRDGTLGTLRHIRLKFLQSAGAPAEAPVESVWCSHMGPSGVLQGIGTHAIDQARFLFGEISTVSAIAPTYVPVRQNHAGKPENVVTEEGAAAVVMFENGASGVIECSCVTHGRKNQLAWEVYGSKGSVSFDLESPNYLQIYLESQKGVCDGFTSVNVTGEQHPYSQYWWPRGHNLGWEHGHINLLEHFLRCVGGAQQVAPLGATFEDGYKAACVVEAIREAARTGCRADMRERC